MKPNTITFIIAVYNAHTTLNHCLESIVDQSHPNWELILIDGGSTDGTPGIIHAYSNKIAYWESKPDRGIYHAWNKALRHAGGEWICFLGADDYLAHHQAIEEMLPFLDAAKKTNTKVVYGSATKIDTSGKIIKRTGKPWRQIAWQIRHGMPFIHAGVFHHQLLFKLRGMFDERYLIAGDYEFLLRELKDGDALFANDTHTVIHKSGGLSDKRKIKTLFEVLKARRHHKLPFFSWVWTLVLIRELFTCMIRKK